MRPRRTLTWRTNKRLFSHSVDGQVRAELDALARDIRRLRKSGLILLNPNRVLALIAARRK